MRLNKLVKRVSSVLGCPLDFVEEVVDRRMLAKLTSIMDNSSYLLHHTVKTAPSAQEFYIPSAGRSPTTTSGDFLTVYRESEWVPISPQPSASTPALAVFSPLLYTLYTYDCVSTHPDNAVIKFADDTTLVGLISDGDEMAYKDKFQRLVGWCADNNFVLNISKTKQLIVDFRRRKSDLQPIRINGESVERVPSFKFLGAQMDADLQWSSDALEVVKRAQQCLHFLRILRRINLNREMLTVFHCGSIESVLTYYIPVWFSSCTMAQKKVLHRVINTAQKIIGPSLPSLEDLYSTRCLRMACSILKDCTHPGHQVFELVLSGRRFRALKARTKRLRDSFHNRAIALLNANTSPDLTGLSLTAGNGK